MLFLHKTIHGKIDININEFIRFSHPAKDLRSSKFIQIFPVKPCHKLTQESHFQRICCYSNYLSALNISSTAPEETGHGNKFERISSNFNFEWTNCEFSKIRNKFESLCSNFELSIKRASDISPFHLVPRGTFLGRLCSHLANRGRTEAKTKRS